MGASVLMEGEFAAIVESMFHYQRLVVLINWNFFKYKSHNYFNGSCDLLANPDKKLVIKKTKKRG